MEVISLILIIIIFIVFYKNREKQKHIEDLKNKLHQIDKEYKELKFEYSKKKEYIDSTNELLTSENTKNKEVDSLKNSLEYAKKENLILKSKIEELKNQNIELEKAIAKLKINYNEELRVPNKENEDKLNKLKENKISKIDDFKNIINDKDIGNNKIKNEEKVQKNHKNKANNKVNKIQKEQSKNINIEKDKGNLHKHIANKFLSNEEKNDTTINNLQSKDEIIKRAKDLANNNLWNDEAIKLNRSIIEFDKKNIAAHTRLAKCYVVKENYIMAEKLYREVLTVDSNNTIAKNRLHDVEILIKRQFNYKFFKILKYLENQFNSIVTIDRFNEEFLIFYNDIYNPYRKGRNRRFREKEDRDILRLKDNEVEVIEKYSNLFNLKLKNIREISDVNNIIIMSIPSSKVGKKNGINYVAENIAKKNGFLDKSNSLIRIKDIHKLSAGGRRDKDVHLNSIKYKEDECHLSNKTIILIDDIITTGNSLTACREILMGFGAKQIVGLGIGRTYSHNG